MRNLLIVPLLLAAMVIPASAAGPTLFYRITIGGEPLPERVLPMDSAEACDTAVRSLLAGPFAAGIKQAGGTFTAGCR